MTPTRDAPRSSAPAIALTADALPSVSRRRQILAAPCSLGWLALALSARRGDQRRRPGQLGQRRHVRAAGAGPEHRRRLRRPARPGLRGLLRLGAYSLRPGGSFQLKIPWSVLGCRSSGSARSAGASRQPRRRAAPLLVLDDAGGRRALCAGFGILFGAPTLRLRGDYLAIVTLGFGEIVPIVLRNCVGLTNGAQGLAGIRTPKLFGFGFGFVADPFYYLILALVALVVFVSYRLQYSRIGRRLAGPARGRARRRADGHQPRQVQAAGVRHRRRRSRAGRHVLRRQADHRHPGHVPVHGLDHHPGHGGAGRHGQHPRRGARRAAADRLPALVLRSSMAGRTPSAGWSGSVVPAEDRLSPRTS